MRNKDFIMHLIQPIRTSIEYALQTSRSGMKAIIMDDFTTSIISAIYARSELLLREVYLFEQIDNIFRERLNDVRCIVILRPTSENVDLLCRELDNPHYRSYYLFFTYKLSKELIKKLAESDESEVVHCFKEFSIDYQAITPSLFSFGLINTTYDLITNSWIQDGLTRSVIGLSSVLFSLNINPMIRYQTQSRLCKYLAQRVALQIRHQSISNPSWRKTCPLDVASLLIIVDRRFDVVTPFMNSWSYQSMIHNQLNIVNNKVNLENVPNRKPTDPKEILLTMKNDPFYSENYHKNFFEVNEILLKKIEEMKTKRNTEKQNWDTLDDLRKAIQGIPETRRQGTILNNHSFLMAELFRIVSDHQLTAISECEQELASKTIQELISNEAVRKHDAIRLICLYSFYKPSASLSTLLKARKDLGKDDFDIIKKFTLSRLSKTTKQIETVQNITRKIKANVVDNIYEPQLTKLIEDIRKGKLKESEYSFQDERCLSSHSPQKCIIFFVGGLTYDEALIIDKINRSPDKNIAMIVGGTSIHNSQSFIEEIKVGYQSHK